MRLSMATTALAAAIALVGCAGSSPGVSTQADGSVDEELVLGLSIYEKKCASCHGATGGGGTGPKLSDGAVIEAYPDVNAEIAVVMTGPKSMPAFETQLSAEEIAAVVRYTREVLNP